MRKVISIILATALFLSMLPVGYASAEDTTTYPGNIEVYTFVQGPGYQFTDGDNDEEKKNAVGTSYLDTNSLWCDWMNAAVTFRFDGSGQSHQRILATMNDGDYFAVAINVPKAGMYDVRLLNYHLGTTKSSPYSVNSNACRNIDVYLLNGEAEESEIESKLTENTKLMSFDMGPLDWDGKSKVSNAPVIEKAVRGYFTKGTNVIVYKRNSSDGGSYVYVQGIVLDGSGNAESDTAATSAIMTALSGGVDSPEVGEKLSVVSAKIDWASGITVRDLYKSGVEVPDGATLTLETTNENVIAVDSNANSITAVAPGAATVTATVAYDGLTKETEFDLTVPDIEAGNTITIAVDDDGDGAATVDSTKVAGDSYTVEAQDRSSDNLEFRGWVRGSAENGTWVSNENPYTFTVTTNTYLTAVYSAAATEKNHVTEYYNWNGAYLGTEEKEPTLTGYSFREWVTTKVSDILSRAVAQYTVEDAEYSVTTEGSFDISVEGGKYVYDAKVTCESDSPVFWYRDSKCVDYGSKYIFNVWGDTKITASSEGSTGPKIMLDEVEKAVDSNEKSYMIEYDKGDKSIVEVGILFGDAADPTVKECKEKMTSQKNADHGQFSATSEYAYARGFLIYDDNGTYRVIYAD